MEKLLKYKEIYMVIFSIESDPIGPESDPIGPAGIHNLTSNRTDPFFLWR